MLSTNYKKRKTKSVIPYPAGFFEAVSLRMGLWMLHLGEGKDFLAYHNFNYIVDICCVNDPDKHITIPQPLVDKFKELYDDLQAIEPIVRFQEGLACARGHIPWPTWRKLKNMLISRLNPIAAQIEMIIQEKLKHENIPIQLASETMGVVSQLPEEAEDTEDYE